MKSKSIIILFIFQSLLFNQVIGEGMYLDDLLTYLKNNYTTNKLTERTRKRALKEGEKRAKQEYFQ